MRQLSSPMRSPSPVPVRQKWRIASNDLNNALHKDQLLGLRRHRLRPWSRLRLHLLDRARAHNRSSGIFHNSGFAFRARSQASAKLMPGVAFCSALTAFKMARLVKWPLMTRLLGEPLSGGAVCVVAHDSDDFVARLRRNRPGPDAEINALENPYAREAFAYLAHLQDRLSATWSSLCTGRHFLW